MKRSFHILLSFILLLVLLSSCKTQNLFESEKPDDYIATLDSVFYNNNDYEYRIKKDDKVSISLWGQDELSIGSVYGIYNSNEVYGKWLLVDAQGMISLPKIGPFYVEGKSVIEMKDTLKTIFSKWVQNPVVDVKILNKEITILGEVRTPGVVKIDKDRNQLMELIARCSGFEFYANLKKIKVLRQVGADVAVTNIDLTKADHLSQRNLYLLPGDVVIIPSKRYKEFDKRISVIIPLTTTVSAAAIIMGLF